MGGGNCNMGKFVIGAIENMGDLQWGRFEGKHTQQHRANCNMGELQYGRIAIRPYNVCKHTHANINVQ